MPQGKRALNFCMWDEAYSTSEARHVIKAGSNKRSSFLKHKDSVAASLILKSFLKFHKND
jgi:RNase H-fold protein (predicted Holliday junction resolvase)